MSHSHDNDSHYVRRVVLPSGRAIEVVYFDAPEATAPSETQHGREGELVRLESCPECEERLVYPTEWHEISPTHWEVALRCPNCEFYSVGEFDQASVDRFDEELDRGTEALVRDLKRLTRANMEDEVERFANALSADAIWPMDF